jgi:hypothetical protein
MRTSLTIIFILFTAFLNAQINNVRIYSDNESSCYLNQINDTLIYMTFEEYPDCHGYLLGMYQIKEGVIVINEISGQISLKKDVYYWDRHDVHKDSLLIEYTLTDYLLNGFHNIDSLKFEINGDIYAPSGGRSSANGHSVIIKRPVGQFAQLNIFDEEEKISAFNIELKEGKRAVLIREAILYSIPAFITDTFEELVPDQISVQNKKYGLIINLVEY